MTQRNGLKRTITSLWHISKKNKICYVYKTLRIISENDILLTVYINNEGIGT